MEKKFNVKNLLGDSNFESINNYIAPTNILKTVSSNLKEIEDSKLKWKNNDSEKL